MKNQKGILLLTSVIAIVVFARLIPHAPNFTPVGAVTLLGAGFYSRKVLAFVVPILSLWLSDLIINNVIYAAYFEKFTLFTSFQIYTFASIALTALLGMKLLTKINVGRILGGSVAAALIFFFLTNFGSWLGNPLYSQNFVGLITSYVAGLPFLLNMLASNVVFGFALFYGYLALTNRYQSFTIAKA
jgi:hypothetical protein